MPLADALQLFNAGSVNQGYTIGTGKQVFF